MSLRLSCVSAAIAPLLGAALTIACVPQAMVPDDCGASLVQRTATLTTERLSPNSIEVCRGQQLSLDIVAEVNGEVHLHGYDHEVPASEVRAGETLPLVFTAVRSGQFIFELHLVDGSEVEVGLLVVHER